MCGIHGILTLGRGEAPDRRELERMARASRHRGPDDQGEYIDGPVAFGMRRLSIIDVEGGHQPISNEDGSIWVVCNGEIYNYRALKRELTDKGHRFRTNSDTEVLVHLYEEYAERLVKHIDGMFAFALWDRKRKRLLLGRDPLGIKPLYYAVDGDRIYFASEAKSIVAARPRGVEINGQALSEYLSLGYVPGPQSLIEGIKKLPPATFMLCAGTDRCTEQYWTPACIEEERLPPEEWVGLLRDQLRESVQSQMVSDVPLGAFLSGGVDSSAVVAMMAEAGARPLRTYSIGFAADSAGRFYDETQFARKVATRFGTEHREIIVRPDVVSLLPKLLWHLDEPVADAAFITTYLVSAFARTEVKVILSGVGGDELFGGYRRYLGEHYGDIYDRVPKWLREKVIRPTAQRLPSDRHSSLMNLSRYAKSFLLAHDLSPEDRYRSYVQVYDRNTLDSLLAEPPTGVEDALDRAFRNKLRKHAGLDRLIRVDLETQLPEDLLALTDRMSMATSLECRVPLLDKALVEMSFRIPANMKVRRGDLKHIFKRALKGTLPDEILERQKRGFGAPVGAWLKNGLSPVMKRILSKRAIEKRGLLRWEEVEKTIRLHESNRQDGTDQLMSLMNLEIWSRMYMDGSSAEQVSGELSEELAA